MSDLSIGTIFGTYSGIITSLGLTLGMYGGNLNKKAYIIGLISIALSDSFSDAFGIYNATEYSLTETLYTFLGKFIFPLLMILPFLLFNIRNAVIVNIIMGSIVIGIISSKQFRNINKVIKSLILTWIVITIVYFAGLTIQ
jgi:vacuolar iron transporter family protein